MRLGQTPRTPLLEFFEDLCPGGFPVNRLDAALRNFAGTLLQFARPGCGDLLVGFLQAGKQFLGDASTLGTGETQSLCEQLIGGHT